MLILCHISFIITNWEKIIAEGCLIILVHFADYFSP